MTSPQSKSAAEFVARCRQYAEKATAAPWHATGCMLWVEGEGVEIQHRWIATGPGEEDGYDQPTPVPFQTQEQIGQLDESNCQFAAQARTDLPAALDIIETLVRERDEMRGLCRDAGVALSAYVLIDSDSPDLELMLKLKAEGKSL